MANQIARQSDDTTLPDQCYTPCASAYQEAQSIGKDVSLCNADLGKSPFFKAYSYCQSCIDFYSTSNATASPLEPQFQQFLQYCSSQQITIPATYITVSTATDWVNTTLSNGVVTSLPHTSVKTLPNLAAFNVTVTSSTTGSSSNTTSGLSSTHSLPATGTSTPRPESTQPALVEGTSKIWIAGAVIGPVAAVALIAAFLAYRIRRRKRSATRPEPGPDPYEIDPYGKAQLHGDSLNPRTLALELEPSPWVPPQEMDAEACLKVQEMGAEAYLQTQEMDTGMDRQELEAPDLSRPPPQELDGGLPVSSGLPNGESEFGLQGATPGAISPSPPNQTDTNTYTTPESQHVSNWEATTRRELGRQKD